MTIPKNVNHPDNFKSGSWQDKLVKQTERLNTEQQKGQAENKKKIKKEAKRQGRPNPA